jgi:hypothetical protein
MTPDLGPYRGLGREAGKTLRLVLAVLVAVLCLAMVLGGLKVEQGTGILISVLAAGGGWLIRDLNEKDQAIRNICQAYASFIETHFAELSEALGQAELRRFLHRAPSIAEGREAESIGFRDPAPFDQLPDIRDRLHLLSEDTVRHLTKWRSLTMDLFQIYDQIGTRKLSSLGVSYLEPWFRYVGTLIDNYERVSRDCLLALAGDMPGITVRLDTLDAYRRARSAEVGAAGTGVPDTDKIGTDKAGLVTAGTGAADGGAAGGDATDAEGSIRAS